MIIPQNLSLSFRPMKKMLLFLVIPFTLLSFVMHDYFFAFAELEYNSESSSYELSIQTTAHDFEDAMAANGVEIGHIEKVTEDSVKMQQMEDFINKGFKLKNDNHTIHFDLIGLEVNLEDRATFYLKSDTEKQLSGAELTFDLMMNTFRSQQNKLTILRENNKSAYVFLEHQRKRNLE